MAMKLSTGKVAFPIEFDNGDKDCIYFNPNDPDLATRLIESKDKIQKRIEEMNFDDIEMSNNGEAVAVDEIKSVFQKNIEDFNLKIALINEDELIKYHSTKDLKDINKILNENELILNKLNKLIISISEIDENEDIKQLIF